MVYQLNLNGGTNRRSKFLINFLIHLSLRFSNPFVVAQGKERAPPSQGNKLLFRT